MSTQHPADLPKPCPFCGGVNIVKGGFAMFCYGCGAEGPDADKKDSTELVEKWNARAALARAQPSLTDERWAEYDAAVTDVERGINVHGALGRIIAFREEVAAIATQAAQPELQTVNQSLTVAQPVQAQGVPSGVQARAIDLHEKAGMPWPDAEQLALSEIGADDAAVDELIGESGGLDQILLKPDELRQFTRSILVHGSPLLAAVPLAAVQQDHGVPCGWVVWWPAIGGGQKEIYRPGAAKPSYGQELDALLRVEPVYAAPQAAPQQAEPLSDAADMFWDAEDGERYGDDIRDIISDYGPGDVVKIDCAKRLPSVRVQVIGDEGDYEVLVGTKGAK